MRIWNIKKERRTLLGSENRLKNQRSNSRGRSPNAGRPRKHCDRLIMNWKSVWRSGPRS